MGEGFFITPEPEFSLRILKGNPSYDAMRFVTESKETSVIPSLVYQRFPIEVLFYASATS